MRIDEKVYQSYRDFIRDHCPTIKRCKHCKHYKGKCTHESHPVKPLFEQGEPI
jgi:hypothetical protein